MTATYYTTARDDGHVSDF